MSQKFQMMFQIAESSFEELPRVCRTPAYVKRYLELHDALYTAIIAFHKPSGPNF